MIQEITVTLARWHRQYGRHDLPWQYQGPYATWLSEIMLQQTQVATVIPYYHRFMERFPSPNALANAHLDDVLGLWAGLGYYARARHLHHAAQQMRDAFNGQVPDSLEDLLSLKGIGRSTAGAILSLGYQKFGVIQDGNVRRVLSRLFCVKGDLTKSSAQKNLWKLATELTPRQGAAAAVHNQAIMDLGAMLCTPKNPQCEACPLASVCEAQLTGQTQKLPEPKFRKRNPSVEWVVLQLVNDRGQTWLTKRPAKGIWGGLYTPIIGESLGSLLDRLEVDCSDAEEIRSLSHAFSHFDVLLTLYRLKCSSNLCFTEGQWVDLAHFEGGLPAPINRLLKE